MRHILNHFSCNKPEMVSNLVKKSTLFTKIMSTATVNPFISIVNLVRSLTFLGSKTLASFRLSCLLEHQ